MISPRMNVDRFTATKAKRLRFTIAATNRLEPCLDELEVFNTAGENVALASLGAKVTSSGDNVAVNRHELRFVNDGEYGNSRSWMSNEMGKGWVIVEGRMVVAPYGADVLATDKVRVDGELWDVDGAPGDYENRRGKGKATIFYLAKGS